MQGTTQRFRSCTTNPMGNYLGEFALFLILRFEILNTWTDFFDKAILQIR